MQTVRSLTTMRSVLLLTLAACAAEPSTGTALEQTTVPDPGEQLHAVRDAAGAAARAVPERQAAVRRATRPTTASRSSRSSQRQADARRLGRRSASSRSPSRRATRTKSGSSTTSRTRSAIVQGRRRGNVARRAHAARRRRAARHRVRRHEPRVHHDRAPRPELARRSDLSDPGHRPRRRLGVRRQQPRRVGRRRSPRQGDVVRRHAARARGLAGRQHASTRPPFFSRQPDDRRSPTTRFADDVRERHAGPGDNVIARPGAPSRSRRPA